MFRTAKLFPILSLSAALLLAACGGDAPAQSAASAPSSTPAATQQEYVVGFDASYAPFEYEENGQVVGFSADILTAIAENQGLKFRFVNTPWEGIFATLNTGDRDIISSSVTITAERAQTMDFSDPYFEATQMIVVPATDTTTQSFADLKTRVVSVQSGTTGDLVMQKLQGEQSASIKRFDVMPLALKELLNGGAQASVGDNGVIQNFVNNNPDAQFRTLVDPSFETEHYGFAIKKDRGDDLRAKLNAGLATIRANGTYDRIYAKWFSNNGAAPAAASNPSASAASTASAASGN